jgi:glycosyltransferase involved in cell wall biosynthesis
MKSFALNEAIFTTAVQKAAKRVLLIAPVPPPYGGMALQAQLLQRLLMTDGATVDVLGHNRAFARFTFLERLPGIRTVIRTALFCGRFWRQSRNADVIHILAASWLNFFLVVYPALLIGRVRGRRLILNYRAGGADLFFRYCGWLITPGFKMATVTTAPSGFLADVIRRRIGVRVSIVPNIVNLSAFKFRQRLSFRPKILVTRHLERIYDLESILRAFYQLQLKYPGASLWIAGTGSQEKHLRKLVSDWMLENVEFLGHVDHGALPSICDQCDFLVNASRIDNFPGSLLEGSAAGLVVVSTRAGGIPFLYEDGKDALLVDVGDTKGLVMSVERVLHNPELGQRLAAEALKLCCQFEWGAVRTALYPVYGFGLFNGGSQEASTSIQLNEGA